MNREDSAAQKRLQDTFDPLRNAQNLLNIKVAGLSAWR